MLVQVEAQTALCTPVDPEEELTPHLRSTHPEQDKQVKVIPEGKEAIPHGPVVVVVVQEQLELPLLQVKAVKVETGELRQSLELAFSMPVVVVVPVAPLVPVALVVVVPGAP